MATPSGHTVNSVLLDIFQKNQQKKAFIMAIISYFLIAFNIKNPEPFYKTLYGSIILSHGFFGTLMLWLILIFNKNK